MKTSNQTTILIVEDEWMILRLAEKVLEQYGYEVLIATDPYQAIYVAGETQGKIDLLLSDVGLPKMGALEMREKIREMQPDIRTIFLSGLSPEDLEQKGVDAQKEDVIFKPCQNHELVGRVQYVLQ